MESPHSLHWLQKLEIIGRLSGMLCLAALVGFGIRWLYLQEKPPVVESFEFMGAKVMLAQGIDSAQKVYSGPIEGLSEWSKKLALASADKQITIDPTLIEELDTILKDFGVAQETLDAKKSQIELHAARAESEALETRRKDIQTEIRSLEEKQRIITEDLKKSTLESPFPLAPTVPTNASVNENETDESSAVVAASTAAPIEPANNAINNNEPEREPAQGTNLDAFALYPRNQDAQPFMPNPDRINTETPITRPKPRVSVTGQEGMSDAEFAELDRQIKAKMQAYEDQYLGSKTYLEERQKKALEKKSKGLLDWIFRSKTNSNTKYLESFPSATKPVDTTPKSSNFGTRSEVLGPPPGN